jgi:hypothetical protein
MSLRAPMQSGRGNLITWRLFPIAIPRGFRPVLPLMCLERMLQATRVF